MPENIQVMQGVADGRHLRLRIIGGTHRQNNPRRRLLGLRIIGLRNGRLGQPELPDIARYTNDSDPQRASRSGNAPAHRKFRAGAAPGSAGEPDSCPDGLVRLVQKLAVGSEPGRCTTTILRSLDALQLTSGAKSGGTQRQGHVNLTPV